MAPPRHIVKINILTLSWKIIILVNFSEMTHKNKDDDIKEEKYF